MNIGIDIDDTIGNTCKLALMYAEDYVKNVVKLELLLIMKRKSLKKL